MTTKVVKNEVTTLKISKKLHTISIIKTQTYYIKMKITIT